MELRRTQAKWSARLLLILAMAGANRGFPQETAGKLAPQEQPQRQEAEASPCDVLAHCVNSEDTFSAVLTQVIESDTSRSRLVRLNIKFHNLAGRTIVLAARAHSSFLIDSFDSTYFCCSIVEAVDKSVIGMGINADSKVDPQFRLEAQQSDVATFQVSRPRPPDQPSSYLRYDVTIEEIDPYNLTVARRHILTFKHFTATWREPRH